MVIEIRLVKSLFKIMKYIYINYFNNLFSKIISCCFYNVCEYIKWS